MPREHAITDRIDSVARIMDAFGIRTGLTSAAAPRRYLWTDAFAVCNYLALHRHTAAPVWLECARQLVEQVHRVLGRHRADDPRTGWISGLDETMGARHPTAGGLRIGKPLPERGPAEAPDERLDWDRDGQYYHYLTRWMHALERAAAETEDAELLRYGVELAQAAHAAFTHRLSGEKRLYWKLNIDLSRPVVPAMGQHDALDGLAAAAALRERAAALRERAAAGGAGAEREGDLYLDPELEELAEMCTGRGWATADALGIGGLLADAWFLAQLTRQVPGSAEQLLTRVLRDAARSLDLVTTGRYLDGAAHERLPFRELGLSLGLAAVERLEGQRRTASLPGGHQAGAAVQSLLRHVPLRRRIESFWEQPPHQTAGTWTEHEDINSVMLATRPAARRISRSRLVTVTTQMVLTGYRC
ncbi:MAG: hypothetical protein ACRELT_15715 [Longimicrobiales bacterium]